MRRSTAVRAGGWLTLAFGTAHTVLAAWGTRAEWARIHREGWWDTVRLEPDDEAGVRRAMVAWFSVASFGVPCAVLGAHLVSTARQGRPVPRWVGGTLLAWSVPMVVVLPRSPTWTAPVFASLLLLGAGPDEVTPPSPRTGGAASPRPPRRPSSAA